MKTNPSKLIKVGLFVALGLGLAMTVIFFIGKEKNLFEKRYTLFAHFKDVSGLRMGAVVQLAGVSVGFVDGVEFPKDEASDRLIVILKISKTYKERIREDSRASIETQGLLGDRYIMISTGSPNAKPLEDEGILAVRNGGGLNDLTNTTKEAMDEIQKAAKKFSEALDKLPLQEEDQQAMREILQNLNLTSSQMQTITSKINKGEGTVGAFLTDPALYHDFRALMGHANRNKLLKKLIRATIAEQEKTTGQSIEP